MAKKLTWDDIVSKEPSGIEKCIDEWYAERHWRIYSQRFAFQVIQFIRNDPNNKQKLIKELSVTEEYIKNVCKGCLNLTLGEMANIQTVIGKEIFNIIPIEEIEKGGD